MLVERERALTVVDKNQASSWIVILSLYWRGHTGQYCLKLEKILAWNWVVSEAILFKGAKILPPQWIARFGVQQITWFGQSYLCTLRWRIKIITV